MIDFRIMNDLSDDEKPAIFENLSRGICEVDRAFDAIAEPKLLCQTHRCIADRNDSAGVPDFFDNVAAIMRLHLLLYSRHYVRRAQVHFLARRRAAGNQIRAHTLIGVILSAAKNLGLFWRPDGSKIVAKMLPDLRTKATAWQALCLR